MKMLSSCPPTNSSLQKKTKNFLTLKKKHKKKNPQQKTGTQKKEAQIAQKRNAKKKELKTKISKKKIVLLYPKTTTHNK